MKQLEQVDGDQFARFFKIEGDSSQRNFFTFFERSIDEIKKFAIAPYFWYISNNYKLCIDFVSDNIGEFTPYSKEQWLREKPEFFAELYHPDDRVFILSAIHFIATTYLGMDVQTRDNIKINIYVRMLNRNNEYRWVLMQSSKPCMNEDNRIESAISIFFDLSDFEIRSRPLLSLMDYNTKETRYYSYHAQQIQNVKVDIPKITKREKEILVLISKGLNTPKIAGQLFISYHTVENHKRNLRQKTNTKTSAELVGFALTHNLLF